MYRDKEKKNVVGVVALILAIIALAVVFTQPTPEKAPAAGSITNGNFTRYTFVDSTEGYSVNGTTILDSSLNLTASGAAVVGTLTQGGGIRATSSVPTAITLLASDFDTENVIDFTPNTGNTTVTLPATSTLTSFLPTAGQCRALYIRNATTTSGILTTIAGGTGTLLKVATSTVPSIKTGKVATLNACRRADTDIDFLMSVFDN